MPSTLLSLTPLSADFAVAANAPVFAVRNGRRYLGCADGVTSETFFTMHLPESYAGAGIDVVIMWAAATVTSGNALFGVSFERNDDEGLDLDSDSFAAEKTTTGAAPSTNGQWQYTTISFSDAEIDGLVAGEQFRIRVRVLGTDSAHTIGDITEIYTVRLSQDAAGGGSGYFNEGSTSSAAVGKGTVPPTATQPNTLAHGDDCNATGVNSVALGDGCDASGLNAFAHGLTNSVGGANSVSFGQDNALLTRPEFAVFGRDNTTSNTPSFNDPTLTAGRGNHNAINRGVVLGENNEMPSSTGTYTTHGMYNAIIGHSNHISGYNYQNFVFGFSNIVGPFALEFLGVGHNVGNTVITQGGPSQCLMVGEDIDAGAYPAWSAMIGQDIAGPSAFSVSETLVVGQDVNFNYNTAYGYGHVALGRLININSRYRGFAHGRNLTIRVDNQRAFSSSRSSTASWNFIVDYLETTDATTTAITSYPLQSNHGYAVRGKIVAYNETTQQEVASLVLSQATVIRDGGGTTLVNAPKAYTNENSGGNAASFAAQLQLNGTNLEVQVTGVGGETVNWVSLLEFCEVTA